MNLNRRSFLKSSSILLGGLMFQGNKAFTELVLSESDNFREIRNHFGIYNEKGGTIGWYVQDDTVIVIDAQFPDSAKNFMNKLSSITAKK